MSWTLKQGDRVDVVLSSSPPKNDQWKEGVRILKSWGLRIHLPRGLARGSVFLSDEKRLAGLERSFQSPGKAVWALRGGYGSQKLLPFLKRGKISQKLLIGFSDVTALHFYLNRMGHSGLHGPSVGDLPRLLKRDLDLLKGTLFGTKKEIIFKGLKALSPFIAIPEKFPLLGGNLTLLQTSVGYSWMKPFPPCFLFLEDVNEKPYQVDRALCQLFYSGMLREVRAVFLGSFSPLTSRELKTVFLSFSRIFKRPVFMGVPAGHGSRNAPLPLNTLAEALPSAPQAVQLKIRGLSS